MKKQVYLAVYIGINDYLRESPIQIHLKRPTKTSVEIKK